jgi:two-component system sensor histidine kinase DesK
VQARLLAAAFAAILPVIVALNLRTGAEAALGVTALAIMWPFAVAFTPGASRWPGIAGWPRFVAPAAVAVEFVLWFSAAFGASVIAIPAAIAPALTAAERIEYLVAPLAVYFLLFGDFLASSRRWHASQAERDARLGAAQEAKDAERLRLAQDLHDVQGHTLHALSFKLAAVEALLEEDAEAARHELALARGLTANALKESRTLTLGGHQFDLGAELENSRQLLEAAGIDCAVVHEAAVGKEAEPLVARALREGVTNILRHSEATRVWIVVGHDRVEIVNDGAPELPAPARAGGLTALAAKSAATGGELTTACQNGLFTLKVCLALGGEVSGRV